MEYSHRRARKQKQPRLVRTKSRVRVESMPPLLEDPKEDLDVAHDQMVFNCDSPLHHHAAASKGSLVKESVKRERNQSVLIAQYGNSGRWRLITALPELNHQVTTSRRKKDEVKDLNELGSMRGIKRDDGRTVEGTGGCGFFRAAMSACKTCHAIEPSRRDYENRASSQ